MFRTTLIALAAAALVGIPAASAAPANGAPIKHAVHAGQGVHKATHVGWRGHHRRCVWRHHHYRHHGHHHRWC